MACKTYEELYKDVKHLVNSKEDFDSIVEIAKNASYEELVDMYEGNRLAVMGMMNAAQPWIDKQRVEILDVKDGYEVSYKYLTSDKVYTKKMGENGITFGEEGMTFTKGLAELDVLYSDVAYINEGKTGYAHRVIDLMNNPDAMTELAQEIGNADPGNTPNLEELTKHLDFAIPKLKQILPKVNLYLNKEAARNGGALKYDGSSADLWVGIGAGNKNRSALEVYVHEIYHAITKFGLESRDPETTKITSQIRAIKNQFLSEVTEEMLIEGMEDKSKGKEQAGKILDYFADEAVGLHEFVAYGMTNPAVMNVLEGMKPKKVDEEHPNIASKLISYVRRLFEKVTERFRTTKKQDSYSMMVDLVYRISEANNRALEVKRSKSIEAIIGAFKAPEDAIKKKMEDWKKKVEDSELPTLKSKKFFDSAVYLSRMAARSMVDENSKRVLEMTAGFMGVKPEGTIMSALRDMSESDDFQDTIERFGLMGQNIDQYREFEYTQVALALKEGFKEELSNAESEGLTDVVLDTDLGTIWGEFDVKGMLDSNAEITSKKKRLEAELRSMVSEKDFRYYKAQYNGLGKYMVDGVASIVQMLNAQNIAEKLNHPNDRKEEVDEKIVDTIDKLATLEALRLTDKDSKKVISELLEKDPMGVSRIIAYQTAHKDKVNNSLFKTKADKQKIIKGYSKEIYPRDLDMQIATLKDEKKMKDLGYKLTRKLERNPLDKNSEMMGIYTSSLQVVQNMQRVGLRLTDKGRRGTSLREGYGISGEANGAVKANRDIARMNVRAAKVILGIEAGKQTLADGDYGIVPTLNNHGGVSDYRYMMNKADKKDLLKMDRRAVNVIGRTYASTYDKENTATFNEALMDEVKKDADKNMQKNGMLGKNMKEYVSINKNSSSSEVRGLWMVLPGDIKAKYPEGFFVRRDMMHSVLGYRELSIADAKGFSHMPDIMKHSVRLAESIWKEIVKIAKVDIILRVPAVLIGNITSNFMYSAMSGYSPIQIAKLQMQGVKELNDFIAKTKEVIRLRSLIDAGKGTKVDERLLSSYKNDLEGSSVKDLIDEGFYMTIIEELGLEEFTTSNRFTEVMEDKMKDMPQFMKDGVNLLYLNERTSVFKAMNMATQYSDFVARYAQYHLMLRSGAKKEVAVKTIRDAFINYNKPNSRLIEYLNQMGFIMFTKYFTRIQKAIKQHAKDHPMKVLIAILGQEIVFGDVEDIYDQSIVTKDLGNVIYNPLDTLLRAITPSGAEALGTAYSFVKA